jgi:PAS domain S-box-containing protein
VDANFHIVDVNPRFEELFGYSREEIKGAHINDLVVQRDKIEEATMLEERAKQGLVYFDTVRKKKDGSLIPVSISVAPMISEGKLLGYIAIYKDVSESRRAEETLKALNEKLQVVGSLTRHDIRNRLAVLYAYIFQLRKRLSQDEKAMQDLAEMELSSKQILRILEFSRAYEKLGTEEPGRINVERCFNDAVSLFSDLRGVRVLNECGGLSLLADSLLTQIFYNLIDNSLKYGERLTQIKISYEKAPNMVRLIYEDDGVGISESVRGNLFKDGCGRGTGHGLYLIRKICETYGWTINETVILGRGVRFTVSIPKTSNNNQRQLYTLG